MVSSTAPLDYILFGFEGEFKVSDILSPVHLQDMPENSIASA